MRSPTQERLWDLPSTSDSEISPSIETPNLSLWHDPCYAAKTLGAESWNRSHGCSFFHSQRYDAKKILSRSYFFLLVIAKDLQLVLRIQLLKYIFMWPLWQLHTLGRLKSFVVTNASFLFSIPEPPMNKDQNYWQPFEGSVTWRVSVLYYGETGKVLCHRYSRSPWSQRCPANITSNYCYIV